MSGTSLDGLDMAYCYIWKENDHWEFEIKEVRNIVYGDSMKAQLKHSIYLPAEELLVLHNTYGTWLGEQSKSFIDKHKLQVDFIASHGHTTHHRPELGLTFQIGSGQHLANASGHQVVCDFRANDLALGGQGAPLVPIGDTLFFDEHDFCLNLGGISNISFQKDDKRIAYDIGLANMILNHITTKIDLAYDENGQLARQGQVNEELLGKLNALPYYQLPYPKSLGFEWFVDEVVPLVDGADDTIANLLHTAIHHNCEQIASQVLPHCQKAQSTLLITGGGALNGFFVDVLQQKLGERVQVAIPSKTLIAYKEALVFALMGVLRIQKENNILASVTGASRDSSSGVVYWPI